jgi:hypothetical protein
MEVLGYFLIALAAPALISGLACLIFVLSPPQRAKPSIFLVVPSALSAFVAIIAFTALITFLGTSAFTAFTVGLLAATLSLAGPVLVRAFMAL